MRPCHPLLGLCFYLVPLMLNNSALFYESISFAMTSLLDSSSHKNVARAGKLQQNHDFYVGARSKSVGKRSRHKRSLYIYHRKTIPADIMPAPAAVRSSVSPLQMRPSATASARAIGIVAAELFA